MNYEPPIIAASRVPLPVNQIIHKPVFKDLTQTTVLTQHCFVKREATVEEWFEFHRRHGMRYSGACKGWYFYEILVD